MTIDIKANSTTGISSAIGDFVHNATSVSQAKVDEKLAKVDEQQRTKVDEKLEKNEEKPLKGELDGAISSLNSSIQTVQRNLQFSVDEDLGKIVINVTDKETDEVVRQIPSEDVLDLARKLQEMVKDRGTESDDSNKSVLFNSTA